jgi:type III pantothenate kinase
VATSLSWVLIDISNSFTKLAFASSRKISRPFRVATERFDRRYLRRKIGRRRIELFVISSVVPEKNREVEQATGQSRVVWVNARAPLGVGVRYPSPRTIGADRLANAAAVAAIYGVPAIVVDFGTAVTFDIVSAKRDYIGGVIAPGLEAMTNFLYQRTALLPKLSLREPRRAVGRSTMEAMRAGAVFGYRGLVREILHQIRREQFPGAPVHVVATGGYAQLIAQRLGEIDRVDPNLTLKGLQIIGRLSRA